METLQIIRASFEIIGTLFHSFLNHLAEILSLNFLPLFDRMKIYFLDHRAMITGMAGFLLLFSLYSLIRMMNRKRVLIPVKK